MTVQLSPVEISKFVAAQSACDFVEDGMRLGLGTGSTAAWFVRCLGAHARRHNLRLTCVATSEYTAALATDVGLDIVDLDTARWLDLTVDGADEVDDSMQLIKGGGGALLREKIVATASDQMLVIADPSKRVDTLGSFPLPIEVIPFGWQTTKLLVQELLPTLDVLGFDITLRMDGDKPARTDQHNLILDLHLGRIANPNQIALLLNQIPGIVENGLFIDICDKVVVGHKCGRVEILDVHSGTARIDHVDIPEPNNLFVDDE